MPARIVQSQTSRRFRVVRRLHANVAVRQRCAVVLRESAPVHPVQRQTLIRFLEPTRPSANVVVTTPTAHARLENVAAMDVSNRRCFIGEPRFILSFLGPAGKTVLVLDAFADIRPPP